MRSSGLAWTGLLGVVLVAAPGWFGEKAPAGDPARLNNLGVAYMSQQRFEKALELFEQAYQQGQESDPERETARLNQGIALLNLQRFDASREVLQEVARKNPQNIRAWYNLGLLEKNLGRPEAALEAFNRTATLAPDDPHVHYFRGLLLSQLERYRAAVPAYERALALNPFHVSAEFGLARAYLRLGESAEARAHLDRFQHMVQENLATPMGLAYGEQGRYSMAKEILAEKPSPPPPIAVRFREVTAEAGLGFRHAGGVLPADDAAARFGSGACFFDYDRDRHADVFLVNSSPDSPSALYRNLGTGRFKDVTEPARLEARGHGLGCAVGDYDNDGWADLAVSFRGGVELYRNRGEGTFAKVTEEALRGELGDEGEARASGIPLGLTFVDYDHDGDLDLYVLYFPVAGQRVPARLWRNNGNGTFRDWTEATGLHGPGRQVTASATDFNNDRAIDLVVTGASEGPVILKNPREGRFPAVKPWAQPVPGSTAGVAVLDFDKDGWMDVAFTHWSPPGLTLWRNQAGKEFSRVELPGEAWQRGWGLAVVDYDNDGWLDLVAVGETEESAEIRLLRSEGERGFRDATAAVGLESVALRRPRAVITADYDSDGDTDLLITENDGPARLLRNDGGNQNNWLRLAFEGLADNKNALGTKVEVFAGGLWQKWEVAGATGYLGQSALGLLAGLGSAEEAEIVRLLWPTGVLQDEVQLAGKTRHTITEIDRRGSSCPILFAWNGERFEFITDAIGAGIVGHWVGPGERNVPDPDEYIKVEGQQLRARAGRLSLRLNEPMEEVVYLDQARLLAIDHPAEIEVHPNEYFAGAPPFPTFRVIASRSARPPRDAWDHRGENVLAKVLHRDRRYAGAFERLRFKGFAELHWIELELGEWDADRPLRLLLHGFVDYFTATSVYAGHQAGVRPVLPYVEALDSEGRWVRVVDNLGFPAGLARTMVADLSGRLPPGTRRIRLVTNLQIYWDQILVDNSAAELPYRVSEAPLAESRLGFLGYPRAREGNVPGDLSYSYEEISPTGPYARHKGGYTRYGDVRALLTGLDDRFVIFGSGEEVALEFDATALPPVPPGWKRDYFFFADGFAKDMDFYEAYALTVEPLPYHRMEQYPYPAGKGYPDADPYLGYRLKYNSRLVSGRARRVFHYQYGAEGGADDSIASVTEESIRSQPAPLP